MAEGSPAGSINSVFSRLSGARHRRERPAAAEVGEAGNCVRREPSVAGRPARRGRPRAASSGPDKLELHRNRPSASPRRPTMKKCETIEQGDLLSGKWRQSHLGAAPASTSS